MNLNINDFTYNLPDDKIARYPLPNRDESKLLVYNKGKIVHERFFNLPDLLPENTQLFFNNTKVIPARILFQKDTGAWIELFLLNPILPSPLLQEAMQAKHHCTWKCTVGNLKRWSAGQNLTKTTSTFSINARLINREEGSVEFTWEENITFAEIIDALGETPLPPYLKREVEAADKTRYQTIYSQHQGAVAAPTAGLHFTEKVLDAIHEKGITTDFLTLHVSAGTFQPVKTENAIEHPMHSEQIVITKKNIESLLNENRFTIPVGTTSMRSLESLYWYGVKLVDNKEANFLITQTDPYGHNKSLPNTKKALESVIEKMERDNVTQLVGSSSIYIYPGYEFKLCKGLITNFHQPSSTLILLVAAFVGEDWKKIYGEALEKNYRFLSYGDSSLLIP